jgi:hypothetical protein
VRRKLRPALLKDGMGDFSRIWPVDEPAIFGRAASRGLASIKKTLFHPGDIYRR